MKRIAIIHTAFIGDIVLSTPFIKKIAENNRGAEIYYVTTPAGKAILNNNPNIKEIIIYDKRGIHNGIKGFKEIVKNLKDLKIDKAYIPHRYLRSSALAFFSGINERIGYLNSGGKLFLNKKTEYVKGIHEVERLFNLVEGDNPKNQNIELFPSEKEIKNIDKIWKERELEGNKVVVIAPGSKWFTKMWPTEYFNTLIKKLSTEKCVKVVVVGGKDEELLRIESGENIENLIGKTSLLELKEIFKRAEVVVTNDSSPIHIASATDTFIIAIFGATVKEFGFYPWSKNSIVLEKKGVECRPCGIHGGKKCPKGHFKCMKDISVDEVYNEIKKRL
jgi:heptosyltransferase II